MMLRMKSLHPISDAPPPERTKAFWGSVRFFIETIWGLFGGPESIAALHTLARTDHRLLAAWLRKAETLVRKLLVIEAVEIEIAEKKYKRRIAAPREPQLRQVHADEPQTWRVTFRVLAPAARVASARGGPRHDTRFCDAWPLAERFEALLRVFDAPELYVQRAARLLRRQAHKIASLAAPVIDQGFEDIFEPIRPLLLEAYERCKTSDTS